MIGVIQVLLVVAALVLVIYGIGNRRTYRGRAWQKMGVLFVFFLMVISVLFPELLNRVAHFVGVGRGADLLLYVIIVAFIFYVVSTYLHHQEQRNQLHSLARKIAILEARDNYKDRLK